MIDAINYRGLESPPPANSTSARSPLWWNGSKWGAPWPKEQPSPRLRGEASSRSPTRTANTGAFQPVGNPRIPKVSRAGWVANPIDAFVLAPSGRKKALRRIRPPTHARSFADCFSISSGLPPAPEEIDAFVADHSPRAYQQLVDDLLSRQQYGERWGGTGSTSRDSRQTTVTSETPKKTEAWRYRDYVIAALNDDKPYNRFVIETTRRGDEIPDANERVDHRDRFLSTWIWTMSRTTKKRPPG